MKRWSKKVWLTAMVLVVAIMSVSASVVTAEASRVVYFSIQSNTYCGASTNFYRTNFQFSINNISDVTANVTVYLYKKDGSFFTESGSSLTPGAPVIINPYSTVLYSQSFGNDTSTIQYLDCGSRPAYGKIVVNSNSSLLLANGEMTSLRNLPNATPPHYELYQTSPVTVNSGQPF
jgi:hypothetical protein